MSDERYGKLFYRMWTDPKFRAYTTAERFSLCYLYAGPDTRTEGLFKLNVREGARGLGISAGSFEEHIERFASEGRLRWDENFDLLLLPRSYRYQPARNGKNAKGIVNRVAAFGSHWMVGELMSIVESVEADFEEAKRYLTPLLRRHINDIGGCDKPPVPDGIGGSITGSVGRSNPQAHSHTHSHTQAQVGCESSVENTRVSGGCFVDEDDEQHGMAS